MLCTTPDVVVMRMHDRVIELRTGLRMMIFSAGMLAGAGTAAGAIAGEERGHDPPAAGCAHRRRGVHGRRGGGRG